VNLRTRSSPDSRQQDDPTVRTTRRKAVLFCPDCGHVSHVDGDWVRRESAGRTSYVCPDCGAVVVSQPAFAAAAGD